MRVRVRVRIRGTHVTPFLLAMSRTASWKRSNLSDLSRASLTLAKERLASSFVSLLSSREHSVQNVASPTAVMPPFFSLYLSNKPARRSTQTRQFIQSYRVNDTACQYITHTHSLIKHAVNRSFSTQKALNQNCTSRLKSNTQGRRSSCVIVHLPMPC